jgi:hypothetical protein
MEMREMAKFLKHIGLGRGARDVTEFIEFDTKKEMEAFMQGAGCAVGWDHFMTFDEPHEWKDGEWVPGGESEPIAIER